MTLSLDFKKMIEIVMEQKPEINLEQIKDLVDQKRRKIGAGYLTDQGALFLVGADLGVSFDNVARSQFGIKDLYVGAKEVNLVARVMSIYPTRVFARKDTGEQIANKSLTVYDEKDSIRVKLWDNLAKEIDKLGLKPGDAIKITSGYVKSGLNGKPLLNLSENSSVTRAEDVDIPDITSFEITVEDVVNEKDNIIISGIIKTVPRIIEFSDSRGERKKSLQVMIADKEGLRKLRVAIWNIDEDYMPKVLRIDSKIRIIGARIKQGNPQYGNGDFEIHGDEGTLIEVLDEEKDYDIMRLRIISLPKTDYEGNINLVALDKDKNILTLVANANVNLSEISIDSILECIPSRIFGNLIVLKQDSYLKILEDNKEIPSVDESVTKLKDMEIIGNTYIIEVIILQQPNSSEVTTRNGENVMVTDALVGDDTGEIRLVGWRESSVEIEKMNVGDRVEIIGGVLNSGRDGRKEMTIKRDSILRKI